MVREIHVRGGNYRRHLHRPWWRRHRSALACTALLAIAILAAHYGGR